MLASDSPLWLAYALLVICLGSAQPHLLVEYPMALLGPPLGWNTALTAPTLLPMSFSTGADDWSPPTSPVNTRTTAPSPSTTGQASGTPPIPSEGPSATPVSTAKYWARISQMELMITSIMAHLAVIEDGLQIASVTARTAPQPSKVLASASKAPSPSSKTSTTPTSHIPRRVA
ncbi:hypothetical protein C0995_013173 [Termitomyces sp. Mi166|nr:hypothetical protein C0995_013173 [Termitomyces sp. Mi166\